MTPEPSSTYAWEREEDVECVVCPDCAFTFDAFHEDTEGGYSCPACAGERLERRLAEKDEALRSILDVTTRWSAKMSLENQIALIDMLAREALRAEPAKEEA